MKLLITGTDGYIGSLLAPFLMERGHEVTGFDTGFYREGWLFHGPAVSPKSFSKDIRRITPDDFDGYEAVIHLAELSNDPLGQLNSQVTYQINHQGSVALAQMAKAAGIQRFVYTSSCSVYGAGAEDVKTEASAPNPQTDYARCKVLVERDVSKLAGDSFSPTFLRNATAYGPSPRMRFDIVLNNLSGLAWTTREIKMTSDGSPWRPLVHVLDICEAVDCVLKAPRETIHSQIFNVGDSRENYRVREIAGIVAEVFPDCKVTFGKIDGDNRSYQVSFDKIQSQLPGFRCRRNARLGAEQLCRLFSMIGLTREMFEARPFTRLKQISHLLQTNQIDPELYWRES